MCVCVYAQVYSCVLKVGMRKATLKIDIIFVTAGSPRIYVEGVFPLASIGEIQSKSIPVFLCSQSPQTSQLLND